jgi:hypothetical protein
MYFAVVGNSQVWSDSKRQAVRPIELAEKWGESVGKAGVSGY